MNKTYINVGNGGGSSSGCIQSIPAMVAGSCVPLITPSEPKMDDHPALLELRSVVSNVTEKIQAKYGPRSAVILMVCIPHPDDSRHDLFSSHVLGSCMTARGLLDWGKRFVMDRLKSSNLQGRKVFSVDERNPCIG